jgi:phage terminase large subunit-like protein
VDYDWVCGWLHKQIAEDIGREPDIIAFDRWRINDFKRSAGVTGFGTQSQWAEVGQGYKDFSPRMEQFEGLLLDGRLAHGGHPLLNYAAGNAIAVRDPAGNRKLDKARSTARIDPLVAALMAVYAATRSDVAEFDVSSMIG